MGAESKHQIILQQSLECKGNGMFMDCQSLDFLNYPFKSNFVGSLKQASYWICPVKESAAAAAAAAAANNNNTQHAVEGNLRSIKYRGFKNYGWIDF